MLEIKVITSQYDNEKKVVVVLDGVDIALAHIFYKKDRELQAAIDEQARVESLAKAQAISYQLMNKRLTETVQSLQRVLVLGADKLPRVEPIALDGPNYDAKGGVTK